MDDENVFEMMLEDSTPATRWAFAMLLFFVLVALMPLLTTYWRVRDAYRGWAGG